MQNSSELEGWIHFQPIHDIINYCTFTSLSESGKFGKEEKKLQKFEYLKNKTSFLYEIKSLVFEELSFGEEIKN